MNKKKWCEICRRKGKPEYNLIVWTCIDCGRAYCENCKQRGCVCKADD